MKGSNKESDDAMKNKIMIMILGIFILGVNGIAYANRTLPENNGGSSNNMMDDYAIGVTYFSKEGGIHYQTITGVVTSVNTTKNVFIVEDQKSKTSITVSTDSHTIAAISQGKTVTVKLLSGSSIVKFVAIEGNER